MRLTYYSAWVGLISFIVFIGLAIYQSCTHNMNEIDFIICEIVFTFLFITGAIITYCGDE